MSRLSPDGLGAIKPWLSMIANSYASKYSRLDTVLETMQTKGDIHIIVTRTIKAPPSHVYRAHLEPDLIRQWMLGMPGWTMPVCGTESRDGRKFNFEWDDGEGDGFAISGQYIKLTPDQFIEHIERMHIPAPTPDNHIVMTFASSGVGTLLTLRMTLPDAGSRQQMLDMGGAEGMEESYAKLDEINF